MLERLSVQGIQFVVGVILARILSPTEYGIMGILLVIIAFLQLFVDSGFAKALIQKQDRTQSDLSTVFFFNIAISIVCYVAIWFGAPLFAAFYEIENLTFFLRVVSTTILFSAFFTIPLTLLTIKLDFKSIAKINLASALISGVVGIVLAYNGWGVWSLIAQTVIKSILTSMLIWIRIKWKPSFVFSKQSFLSLFPYGYRLLISSVLNTLVNNFSSLFIAKMSSARDLGYYTRGTQFADVIYNIFSQVLENVLLPSLATIQREREKLVHFTKGILKSTALILTPIFIGLAVLSKPLILLLLTDKWRMAIPIMQLFCLARLITLISSINVNVLYVIGRTDLALKQQYLKLTIRVIIISALLPYGIVYIAFAELMSTILHFFVNSYYPGKILKYGASKQIRAMLPIFFAGLLMALAMYGVIYFIDGNVTQILVATFIGIIVYLSVISFLRIEEFYLLLNKAKQLIYRNYD